MTKISDLQFTRFTRQVVTTPIAVLATDVAASTANNLLKHSNWQQADTMQASFPARDAKQTKLSPLYDAFKFCGAYASGYQMGFAGKVAYRYNIPQQALLDDIPVVSVSIPVYVDRWLVDGADIFVYMSNQDTPEDFSDQPVGNTDITKILPMEYSNDARIVGEKNTTLEVVFDSSISNKKYLYVILSLHDYDSTRGFWIEGSALILGKSVEVGFSSAVTKDTLQWFGTMRTVGSMDDNDDDRLKNWAQYIATTSGVLMRGNETPEQQLVVWSSITSGFCTDLVDMTYIDGFGLPEVSGAYAEVKGTLEVSSVATVHFFSAPPFSDTIRNIQFNDDLIEPRSIGVSIGYALYQISGYTKLRTIGILGVDSYKNIDFWHGAAQSIFIGDSSYKSSCVLSGVIKTDKYAGASFPVSIAASKHPSIFCLALHVNDIQKSPGKTPLERYGIMTNITEIKFTS